MNFSEKQLDFIKDCLVNDRFRLIHRKRKVVKLQIWGKNRELMRR